jgi:DNA phosphorothioation-associated putative methyltransferase
MKPNTAVGLLKREHARRDQQCSFPRSRGCRSEQRFLSRRHRRLHDISHLLAVPARPTRETKPRDTVLLEAYGELVDAFWARMLELGRLPDPGELESATRENILTRLKSLRTAARLAQQVHDATSFSEARDARVDDLKVYFALNLFNKRKPYQELPSELQRDVKAFFGLHRNALDAGRSLLFSLGNPELIHEACSLAAKNGLGYLDGSHSLQLHADLIERLPATLRTYIGCAEQLYGDVSGANLVKIHIRSGKLTLLSYADFEDSPLPRLVERIKIKMADQDIEFFDYGPD